MRHTIARSVSDSTALGFSSFGDPRSESPEISALWPYPGWLDMVFAGDDGMRPLGKCDHRIVVLLWI